jgi:peptidoglycan/LPS O-acetylase OafA/YrhL
VTDVARRPPTTTPGLPSEVRRLHLDGLRTIAVYLVVAFHAGLNRFSGGFIGVDVFFVLSGYLVTQVLLRSRNRSGSVSFGRFYARRVRRLLPASVVMLVIVAPLYAAVATPAQRVEAVAAFRASFLYVANWHFIGQSTDYFAGDTAASPVLHLWSLAVEEQFYILWPLLLALLLWVSARAGRHHHRLLQALVAGGALASAAWAMSLRLDELARAYFGTEARAYQLLAGALLALTPGLVRRTGRRPRLASLGAAGSLAGILAAAVLFPDASPIGRGLAVTALTAVLLVSLDAAPAGPVARALAVRPMVLLGGLSYATYLWHWPVIVLLTEVTEVTPRALVVITALVATGLAALSLQLVELPIRTSTRIDRWGWPVVAVGVATSILCAVTVPRLLDDTSDTRLVEVPIDVTAFTPVPESFDFRATFVERFGETADCVDRTPDACTVVDGKGFHVMLMGDSNAQMWIPAFTRMAEERGLKLSLAVAPGCLWQREAYKFNDAIDAECRRVKEDAYERTIDSLDPDLLVLTNARESPGPPRPDFRARPQVNEVLRRSTPDSLDQLSAERRRILIVKPAPTPVDLERSPLECLSEAEVVESCRFVADQRESWHTDLLEEEAAARDDVDIADLDRLICPFMPICDPMIGEVPVFWNSSHITRAYSERIGPKLGTWLEANGYLPPVG